MARFLAFFALVLSALVAGTCHGWFFPRDDNSCRRFPTKADYDSCVTCNLFRPKEVTLRVRNVLRDPTFEETVTLNCTRAKTLFFMMQEAADANSVFRFAASYGTYGFFIQSFNGLSGDWALDKSYWEILDGDLKQTPVGASTYEPKAGETVTFNFTQGGHT